MPSAEEVCEIHINGRKFRHWTSVRVETHWAKQSLRMAVVTLAEPGDSSSPGFSAATRIRASDKCSVYLAGVLVIEGFVIEKQVSTSAHQHGVQIAVASTTTRAIRSSVEISPSQYIRKPFQTIAKDKLAPHGINLVVKNPPPGWDKVFRDFNIIPGEGVLDCIDRMARMRGMVLHDDEQGNLVATSAEPPDGAYDGDIVEGRNLKALNSLTSDQSLYRAIEALGQDRGDDNRSGKTVSEPAAIATNSGGGGGTAKLTIIAPLPGDATDMLGIARSELSIRNGQHFNATAIVQGWLKPSGGLWKIGETYFVTAPLHLIQKAKLYAADVIYSQDDDGGTQTAITLQSRQLGQLDELARFGQPRELAEAQ